MTAALDRIQVVRSPLVDGAAAHRLNNQLSWVLIAFLLLVPIPLGSARPLAWVLNASILSLVGIWYWIGALNTGNRIRLPPYGIMSIVGFAVLAAFLMVQVVPGLGPLAPILTRAGEPVGNSALSIAPSLTWLMLLRFMSYGILAFLIAQVAANPDRCHRILVALFVGLALHGGYALIALTQLGDPILFFEKWGGQGDATGTFVNRNSFATFQALGLVTGVGLAMEEIVRLSHGRSPGVRLRLPLYICGIVIIAVAIIESHSRMGLFAALMGSATTMVVVSTKLPRRGRSGWIVASLAAAGLAAALAIYGGGLFERLGSIELSLDVRMDLYRQVWDLILHRPLLGYGGGTFELAYPLVQTFPVSPDLRWDKAHNTYLALWSELGFVGGSVPILLVGLGCLAALRNVVSGRNWLAGSVCLGAAVAAGLHSLADFSLEIEAIAFLFVALLTIGAMRSGSGSRKPGSNALHNGAPNQGSSGTNMTLAN